MPLRVQFGVCDLCQQTENSMIPGRAHALLPFLPFLLASVLTIVVLAQEAVAQTCPALSLLASSCRNDLCEAALGEDVNSCPEDCADPSSQLMAYYTQAITCPPTTIYEPESIQDLQDVVRGIVSSGRKLKPAGTSHSATDVICADDLGDIAQAKRICTDCPALVPCLEGALARREPWGVWGGQIFRNGRMLATKRRRGRPPKVPRPEDQLPVVPIPVHLQSELRSA